MRGACHATNNPVILGLTYVYEDTVIWDREKKNAKHTRHYIGKMNIVSKCLFAARRCMIAPPKSPHIHIVLST